MLIIVILSLILLSVAISKIIPNSIVDLYKRYLDSSVDIGMSIMTNGFLIISWYIIFKSHTNDGGLIVDATMYNESMAELVLIGITIFISLIHTSLQIRIRNGE